MPSGCAPMYVPAPVTTPYRYGLFSVASFPQAQDEHWQCGVEYEPLLCGPAYTTHDPCAPPPAPSPGPKAPDTTVPLVSADPFTVYAGFDCKLVGRSEEEVLGRARAALALGEQRAVEHAFWTGVEGNDPHLADPSAVVLGGGVLSATAGVAALECHLRENYGGTGVIHGPAGAVPVLAATRQLERTGQRLETVLGTPFAAGGGYCVNTGPDGAAAAPGSAWLYATGQVAIWRSDVFLNPDSVAAAFDRVTNDAALVAERTYVVGTECVLAAVQIDVTSCCC